jgi:hypothetical protein
MQRNFQIGAQPFWYLPRGIVLPDSFDYSTQPAPAAGKFTTVRTDLGENPEII